MKRKKAENTKQRKNVKMKSMKDIIVSYMTRITIVLGVTLTIIVILASLLSTVSVLKDSLQMTVKTSSQNISSSLHLLADRLDSLAQESVLKNPSIGTSEKMRVIQAREDRIEFSWIAGYDASGAKLFGDSTAPDNIKATSYFQELVQTGNITIGEPEKRGDNWEISVGTILSAGDVSSTYLVGAYHYGILNEVLSNINIGKFGSAYVVNPDGVIVADKVLSNMDKHSNIYELHTSKSNHKVFDTALSFQTGVESVFFSGTQSYMAYAPIAGTNWTLIIAAPGADFMNILLICIILCVLVILILQFLSRRVSVRVAERVTTSISQAANRLVVLSTGDLQQEVILNDENKEAEVLTSALAKTVSSLGNYIEEIRAYLGQLSSGDYSMDAPEKFDGDFIAIKEALSAIYLSLNETMSKINQASFAVSDNSSDTSNHAKKLYSGSLEQTEALGRLNVRVGEISEKILAIDENARRVKQSADTVGEKVIQGKEQMDSMLTTMNSIYDDMQKIVTISALMEDISSETSLLALNASIEAARAGETGKGFAVVAQQISVLSEQTAEALKRTGEIIQQTEESIANGLKTANATGESFEKVRQATEGFAEISDEMTYIAAEQKATIQTVTKEVQKVLQIADVNQGLARETDEIAEQSLKQAENLERMVSAVKLKAQE